MGGAGAGAALDRGREMLERCDIGHRVVIRHQVGDTNAGRPLLTDVLGELLDLDDERLLVRADDGTEHRLAVAAVTAAKRVPARPPRYSEMLALERAADRAWPAPVHERLGEWYLRAADGWTNRANSALPLGDSGLAPASTVAAVIDWYTARGLRPRITVPLPVRRDVADDLAGRGWFAQPPVLVQAAPVTAMIAAVPASATPASDGITLTSEPSAQFLARLAGWKGDLPAVARTVLAGTGPVAFAEVPVSADVVATARGAVVDGWLHLGLVEVDPAARRQGLARAVTAALARWGATHGATRSMLQVEEHNGAAIALYQRLGFTTHHRYVTFAGPTAA